MEKLSRLAFLFLIFLLACGDDDSVVPGPSVVAPATYSFERDGMSSVSFSGQSTRILMATELIDAMMDFGVSKTLLLEMFRNETDGGGDANPYSNQDLNDSDKSVKSKVAASKDFFSTNTAESASIREDFETWLTAQVDEVFPSELQAASPGQAGQLADGSSVRYVSPKGLEYNQAVNKSLIGALMLDQMLNNYLSTAVLDDGDQVTENDNDVLADGKNYTTMEHKWDEAYGYLFGAATNTVDPLPTLGEDDAFLNKYLGRVEGDSDFSGIAQTVYDALKLGRAAIVAKDYNLRDEQVRIIRYTLSKVIAIRSVYYLQRGKNAIPMSGNASEYGPAFHDLSEGFGFVYSLRFTRKAGTNEPYFTRAEVDGFIADLLAGNGFWDVNEQTLDAISEAIAAKFEFTTAQAGE